MHSCNYSKMLRTRWRLLLNQINTGSCFLLIQILGLTLADTDRCLSYLRVVVCVNDLEGREEEMLPRESSDKRGRSPQLLNS